MNTAYSIALIATGLAIAVAFVGLNFRASNSRAETDTGTWLLVAAAFLGVAAAVFSGIGIDIQYGL